MRLRFFSFFPRDFVPNSYYNGIVVATLQNSTKIYRLSQYSWLRILQYFSFKSNVLVGAVCSRLCFFSRSIFIVVFRMLFRLIFESKRKRKNERNEYCIFLCSLFCECLRIQIPTYIFIGHTNINWNRRSKLHVSSRFGQI